MHSNRDPVLTVEYNRSQKAQLS